MQIIVYIVLQQKIHFRKLCKLLVCLILNLSSKRFQILSLFNYQQFIFLKSNCIRFEEQKGVLALYTNILYSQNHRIIEFYTNTVYAPLDVRCKLSAHIITSHEYYLEWICSGCVRNITYSISSMLMICFPVLSKILLSQFINAN